MRKKRYCNALVRSVLCWSIFVCCLWWITARQRIVLPSRQMIRKLPINGRVEIKKSLINGVGVCTSDHDFPLVVVVCSAVQNVEARLAVRETWGSVARGGANHSFPVSLAFLLGRSENESLQNDIQRESDTYGDVIQEDILDIYNHLTLKSIMLLKWVTRWCPRAQFVMKTDDDMFVNIALLLGLLEQLGRPKLLLGSLSQRVAPIRDKDDKWYAPKHTYQKRVYPDYLSGTGYVMSRDLVPMLYQTTLETPIFHLEDIYITGICADKLNVKPLDHPGFTYIKQPFSVCVFRSVITSHEVTPVELRMFWKEMNEIVKCD